MVTKRATTVSLELCRFRHTSTALGHSKRENTMARPAAVVAMKAQAFSTVAASSRSTQFQRRFRFDAGVERALCVHQRGVDCRVRVPCSVAGVLVAMALRKISKHRSGSRSRSSRYSASVTSVSHGPVGEDVRRLLRLRLRWKLLHRRAHHAWIRGGSAPRDRLRLGSARPGHVGRLQHRAGTWLRRRRRLELHRRLRHHLLSWGLWRQLHAGALREDVLRIVLHHWHHRFDFPPHVSDFARQLSSDVKCVTEIAGREDLTLEGGIRRMNRRMIGH